MEKGNLTPARIGISTNILMLGLSAVKRAFRDLMVDQIFRDCVDDLCYLTMHRIARQFSSWTSRWVICINTRHESA
jgi:hypothetical protein